MIYHAKINWYNEFDGEDRVDHVLISTTDWNGAMSKINTVYRFLNSIWIEELSDNELIYVPEALVEQIKEENQL